MPLKGFTSHEAVISNIEKLSKIVETVNISVIILLILVAVDMAICLVDVAFYVMRWKRDKQEGQKRKLSTKGKRSKRDTKKGTKSASHSKSSKSKTSKSKSSSKKSSKKEVKPKLSSKLSVPSLKTAKGVESSKSASKKMDKSTKPPFSVKSIKGLSTASTQKSDVNGREDRHPPSSTRTGSAFVMIE